jgi:DNA-nicking Smr family endonuclease
MSKNAPNTNKRGFGDWLAQYEPNSQDIKEKNPVHTNQSRKTEHVDYSFTIDACLDLHGLSRIEANHTLRNFLRHCRKQGLRRLLIIYGKGSHSENGAILAHEVQTLLQDHPWVAQTSYSKKNKTGKKNTGSCWVLLSDT